MYHFNALRQRLDPGGRYLITKERDFVDTENTFAEIDVELKFVELGKQGAKVLVMFFLGAGSYKHVINIREDKAKFPYNGVNESLERLCGI